MPRPPKTLWLFLVLDLLRLTALAAGVLVMVIAFGAAIKPLSDGVLQAGDLFFFVALATPPMLAYALPFAAGFASTLVYHRLASEHEATAAYAGGISHRALLAPALLSGVLLAIVLGVLNESVIPRFYRKMEGLVALNLPRLLVQQTARGRGVRLPGSDLMIFADRAEHFTPRPETGADDLVVLFNFAAISLDNQGSPTGELTASVARLWLFPAPEGAAEGTGVALVELERAVRSDGFSVVGTRETGQIVMPVRETRRDKPKFRTRGELRDLEDHPERMAGIDAARRVLALSLAHDRGVQALDAQLRDGGRATLVDRAGEPVIVFAGSLRREGDGYTLSPGAGGAAHIEVASFRQGSASRTPLRTRAQHARLVPAGLADGAAARGSRWTLELGGVRSVDHAGGSGPDFSAAPERSAMVLADLRPTPDPAEALLAMPTKELVTLAREQGKRSALDDLEAGLLRLGRAVLGQGHSRWAMSVSCLVMTVTGAVAALFFARRLPLTVYLFTFLPALVCVVTISGGGQLVSQSGAVGLLLLWGGVAGLGAYTFVMFRGLARN